MSSNRTEAAVELSAPSAERSQVLRTVNWSSFGFAVLQSICAAVLALNGVRFAIGLGSILTAGGIVPAMLKFHTDAIRIPMMIVALVGSIINLLALWQIKRLRNRPAAQWRRVPLSLKQRRAERLQFVLSIATLVLLGIEFFLHRTLHG
jgi:hypothetical protein